MGSEMCIRDRPGATVWRASKSLRFWQGLTEDAYAGIAVDVSTAGAAQAAPATSDLREIFLVMVCMSLSVVVRV